VGSLLVQEKYRGEKARDKRQQQQEQQQLNNNNNEISYLYAQKINRLMTNYIDSTSTYTEARNKQNQNRNKPWPKL
jgi:hypothetical protein